jgi:hypothetical protein
MLFASPLPNSNHQSTRVREMVSGTPAVQSKAGALTLADVKRLDRAKDAVQRSRIGRLDIVRGWLGWVHHFRYF